MLIEIGIFVLVMLIILYAAVSYLPFFKSFSDGQAVSLKVCDSLPGNSKPIVNFATYNQSGNPKLYYDVTDTVKNIVVNGNTTPISPSTFGLTPAGTGELDVTFGCTPPFSSTDATDSTGSTTSNKKSGFRSLGASNTFPRFGHYVPLGPDDHPGSFNSFIDESPVLEGKTDQYGNEMPGETIKGDGLYPEGASYTVPDSRILKMPTLNIKQSRYVRGNGIGADDVRFSDMGSVSDGLNHNSVPAMLNEIRPKGTIQAITEGEFSPASKFHSGNVSYGALSPSGPNTIEWR